VYTIPGNQLPELSNIDHSCTWVWGILSMVCLRSEKGTQPETDTRCPLSDLWCWSEGEV